MRVRNRVIAVLACISLVMAAASAYAGSDGVRGKLEKRNGRANRAFREASLLAEGRSGAVELAKLMKGEWLTVFPEKSNGSFYYVHAHGLPPEKSYGWIHRTTIRLFTGPFEDVPSDHWAHKALVRLKDRRLIKGDLRKHFRGKKPFTRYEMAVVLDRYLKKLDTARKSIMAAIETVPLRANLTASQASQLDKLVASLAEVEELRKSTEERLTKLDDKARKHGTRIAKNEGDIRRTKSRLLKIGKLAERNAKTISQVKRRGGMMAARGGPAISKPTANVLAALAENVVTLKTLGGKVQLLNDKVDTIEKERALAGLLLRDSSSKALLKQVYRETKVLKRRLDGLDTPAIQRTAVPKKIATPPAPRLSRASLRRKAPFKRPYRKSKERLSVPSRKKAGVREFSIASLSERIARKLLDQRRTDKAVAASPVAADGDEEEDEAVDWDFPQVEPSAKVKATTKRKASISFPAADTSYQVMARGLAEKESTIRAMIESSHEEEPRQNRGMPKERMSRMARDILGPRTRIRPSATTSVLPDAAYSKEPSPVSRTKASSAFSPRFRKKLAHLLQKARASRKQRSDEVVALLDADAAPKKPTRPKVAPKARTVPDSSLMASAHRARSAFSQEEEGSDEALGQLSKQVLEISSNLRKIDEKLAEFERELL